MALPARRRLLAIVALASLLLAPALAAGEATPAATPAAEDEAVVVASGLAHPRGFAWDEDGTLVVGLAGTGGPTPGDPPIAPPFGPFRGGKTASIVRIRDGCPVPVVDELPSSVDGFGNTYGVASVAFLGERLYALVTGGGVLKGNPDLPVGVYEVFADGTTRLVADLGAWIGANPVTAPRPWDYFPEGEPFAMLAHRDALWIVESNSGQVLTVTSEGEIARAADLSDGHPVPTGLAAAPDGGVYVGFLTTLPFVDGAAKVVHVAIDGAVTDVWTGLTMITAVAVGPDGALYALEMATGNRDEAPWVRPWTGRVVRQTGPATSEAVATGLLYPVAMAFGPDGGLYVAYPGIGLVGWAGAIVRLDPAPGQTITIGRTLRDGAACRSGTPNAADGPRESQG